MGDDISPEPTKPIFPGLPLARTHADFMGRLRASLLETFPGLASEPPLPSTWTHTTEEAQEILRNRVPFGNGCGKMTSDQQPTTGGTTMSQIDDLQLRVLDVLIAHDGYFGGEWGQVLVSLAQEAFGDEDIRSQDREYQQTSIALLRLEAVGFVHVDRAYRDEAQKANVITAVRLL